MWRLYITFALFMCACVRTWHAPSDWTYRVLEYDGYRIVTYSDIIDSSSPIHIYIEGDGNAFDGYGRPTLNPTPTGTLVRDLAAADMAINVAYIARPCQFVTSDRCTQSDWTDGRFSPDIIESMADAVQEIAQNRPIVLIGYSGGAMISGLIIEHHPELNVQKWVTIAGVLNHSDWTSYFGDTPLDLSLNMNGLPNISQTHYIASNDTVVPNALSWRWVGADDLRVIPNATHTKFPDLFLDF